MAIDRGASVTPPQALSGSDTVPVSSIDRGKGVAISAKLADSFDVGGLLETVLDAREAADEALANLGSAEINKDLSENSAARSLASEKTSTASKVIAVDSAIEAKLSEGFAKESELSALDSKQKAEESNTSSGSHSSDASKSALASAASAAAAASTYDSFDDRYLGAKTTEPTVDNDGDPIIAGMIYFNSIEKAMLVFDGTEWIVASSATKAAMHTYSFTATEDTTTNEVYSVIGVDDEGNTLSLSPGSEMVSLNGVILTRDKDYKPNPNSIDIQDGMQVGDVLKVHAFRHFEVADHFTKLESEERYLNLTEVGVTFVAPDGDGSQLHTITVRPNYITQAHLKEDDELAVKLKGIATNANKYIHPSHHSFENVLPDITDKEFTLVDTLALKADISMLDHYQPEIAGKSLSTYDFTNAWRTKLDSVEAFSNNYVHPDTHDVSMITGLDSTLTTFVSKVEGKDLSTEDFTAALLAKLTEIELKANNYVHPATHAVDEVAGLEQYLTDIQAEAEAAAQAVIDVSAGSAEGLGTLALIGRAINNDPEFYATMRDALLKKVDVTEGKQLSDANFTAEEKIKISQFVQYEHPNTVGNIHIPPGGIKDQFLKWKSDGLAEWAYDRFFNVTAGHGIDISADSVISVTKDALSTTSVVGSEVDQLALSIEEGDIVVRSDLKQTFVKGPGVLGTIDDFILLQTPTDAVASVNGQTGVVNVYEFTEAERLKLAAIESTIAETALQVAQDSYIEDELLDLGWAN